MAETTTAAAAMTFKYTPLPDSRSYIRLLILEAGSGTSPLQGRLKTVCVAAKTPTPVYDAISYACGDSATNCTILLQEDAEVPDGSKEGYHALPITKNLDGVLHRFRLASAERTLWADGICIDQQHNAPEKEAQVLLMSQIYSLAEHVLIYLGPAIETTPKALRLLEKMYDATRATPRDDTRPNLQWLAAAKLPLPQPMEEYKWDSVKDFFARHAWWGRKWTVQECVLAKRPVFYLGEEWHRGWEWMEVVHDTISDRAPALVDHTTYRQNDDEVSEARRKQMRINLQQGLAKLNAIAMSRKELRRSRGERTSGLMQVASRFQTAQCEDKRDRLFSLLGLTKDAEDANGALDPNYGHGADASLLVICLRYARYFLRKYRDLSVLSRAGLNGQRPMLAPSWVPNWYGGILDWSFEHAEGLWDPSQRPEGYEVAPGKLVQFIDEDDDDLNANNPVLGLKGVVIDTVEELAKTYLENEPEDGIRDKAFLIQQQRKRLEESDALLAKFSKMEKYHTGESMLDAYWRTLICNVSVDLDRAPDALKLSFESYRKTLRLNGTSTQDEVQGSRPFVEAFNKSSWLKVFGRTENEYMGMFPISAQKGDRVAVLYGGMFPFVLRNLDRDKMSKANYQLVGQCYVHGIMEGQIDLNDTKRFTEEDIFLGGNFDTVQP